MMTNVVNQGKSMSYGGENTFNQNEYSSIQEIVKEI